MTATAISLIVSSVISAALKDITLLDAIVVTYSKTPLKPASLLYTLLLFRSFPVLVLPIVTSSFGVMHISSQSSEDSEATLQKSFSPLLVLVNWLRSALTYAFVLFVWIQAPTFGSGPPECDQETRFIFFGIALRSLGAGRTLNLAGWGLLTALFAWRTYRGRWALQAALQQMLSRQVLIKPREAPGDELEVETLDRYIYPMDEHEHR